MSGSLRQAWSVRVKMIKNDSKHTYLYKPEPESKCRQTSDWTQGLLTMILKMLSCVIILTVMLHTCLSELDMWYPSQPCTEAKDQNAYDTFLNHHLRKDAPTHTLKPREWQKFINKINTWDRPIQSFFPYREERMVRAVCSSGGKMYQGNLCISKKPLTFFTAEINDKKQVKRVKVQEQHVILGCDKIQNECLPIHFEANINDTIPDNNKPNCSTEMANTSFIPFEELFLV